MDKGLTIRLYEKGDEKELVPLLETCFDRWPHFNLDCSPLDHWKWKYIDNPNRSEYAIVCQSGRDIVGVTHMLFQNLWLYTQNILVYQGVDNAVYSTYRRQGISKELYERSRKLSIEIGAKYRYYSTAHPGLVKYSLANSDMWPEYPFTPVMLGKIYDIDAHFERNPGFKSWIKKTGYRTLSKIGTRKPVETFDETTIIKQVSEFDENIETFWAQTKPDYTYILQRNQTYLNWRYCDPRGGHYTVYEAKRHEDLVGYLVLRINIIDPEYPVGYIIDIQVKPSEENVLAGLIEKALTTFEQAGVNIINYTGIKNSVYHKTLNQYGFVDSRYKSHIFYSPNQGFNIKSLSSTPPDKLHFSYGDYDYI